MMMKQIYEIIVEPGIKSIKFVKFIKFIKF